MFNSRLAALVIVTLVASVAGVDRLTAQEPADLQIELKKGDKIIFFGDSLTQLAIKDSRVPEGKGYVPLVRAALKDRGVEVDAVATGGHRVPNLLARVDKDVIAKKPTVVVIQIGVNDAGSNVTADMFKAQLEELIDKLEKGGVRVVLCSCTCRVEGYNPAEAGDKRLDSFADAARAITKEKKLPLND